MVHAFTFRQIAQWKSQKESETSSGIKASIPALQRGLVWGPQQIEMLWDSILRGFPIGSLVICRKITKQERGNDPDTTHHLLDGQQRCNAIAVGFEDPFPASEEKPVSSILWLDLDPSRDPRRTRNYLTRLTTQAHPWEYSRSDAVDPLGVSAIRAAFKKIGRDSRYAGYCRPSPVELWPHEANVPVPLSWLMLAPTEDAPSFWSSLQSRLKSQTSRPWAQRALELVESPDHQAVRDRIFQAVARTKATHILALVAPAELLEASAQEVENQHAGEEIAHVEHLFQRLNQQGTPSPRRGTRLFHDQGLLAGIGRPDRPHCRQADA